MTGDENGDESRVESGAGAVLPLEVRKARPKSAPRAPLINTPGIDKSPSKPLSVKAPRARAPAPVAGQATADGEPIASTGTKPASSAPPVKTAPIRPGKVKTHINTPPKTAPVQTIGAPSKAPNNAQKEKIMDMASSFGSNFQDVIAEAQGKAKEAFDKSSTVLGDAGEFARGNAEALVESGKILASGLQDMGSSLAAEGRSAFETMTADLKELAAAKTPADFLRIQSELVRKSFDGAVAYGSKNSEAVLKLASEAFAPISGRVSLAVEKARTTV
jgi:phasin family protein